MPRLTNTEYLIRHDLAHNVWTNNPAYFRYLSPKQQRDLHDYFQITSDASDEQLNDHRQQLVEGDPSLPHRAGRAFLAFLRPPVEITTPKKRRSQNSVVRPVLNPEPDIAGLARVLIDHVMSLREEERDRLAEEGRALLAQREKGTA